MTGRSNIPDILAPQYLVITILGWVKDAFYFGSFNTLLLAVPFRERRYGEASSHGAPRQSILGGES